MLTMEKLVALCKNRGYIYSGSEIYGGLANSWDYGPLGAELKNNIKMAWWKKFVQECPYNVGMDSAILMNPSVWAASGHLSGFSDPLMDCKECKSRHRADTLIEDYAKKHNLTLNIAAMENGQMEQYIAETALNALFAAMPTLQGYASLTLCSRLSKELRKMLPTPFTSGRKQHKAYLSILPM